MNFRAISMQFALASTIMMMVAQAAALKGQVATQVEHASDTPNNSRSTSNLYEGWTAQSSSPLKMASSTFPISMPSPQVVAAQEIPVPTEVPTVEDAKSEASTDGNNGTQAGSQGDTSANAGQGLDRSSTSSSFESSNSASANSASSLSPVEQEWMATNTLFSETDVASQGQINFNDFPKNFLSGLTLRNDRWAAKIGGYVKADLIHDFRAIESRDTFDPVTIPIGDPQWTSTRFHARQTRLNCDARWIADTGKPLRIMIEGDFFGEANQFRLRHAYGEYENIIVGQTWTTFTHRAALPNTLDLVGDVASVGRRQTQVRYSKKFLNDHLIIAGAIEDARVTIEDPFLELGVPRSPLPDAILRARLVGDRFQLQIAGLARRIGFQPTGQQVIPFDGGGINTTGLLDFTKRNRLYGGVLWGNGIGSYRDLPDLAPSGPGQGTALETYAWYAGLTHQWNQRWSTNVTYSKGEVNNTILQPADSIQRTQYLATNLIWQPNTSLFIGGELLWGMRMNRDLAEQDASRLMLSFGFLLP